MTIGIGGWGSRRKPMALVRAILRSPLKDLTIVSYAGPDVGLLVASGQAKRVVTGFASLDSIPLEPNFRRARQAGTVELTELDEGMLHWGLLAAAHRLPFLPIRAGLGSGVLEVNPELRTVRSPYPDGEELVAMPALRLDAALVHMNRADAGGNGQYLGPDPYFDDLFCLAAERAYLSCERIVPTLEGPPQTLLLNRAMVHGVTETPNGAHFTSCVPDYGRDEAFQKRYAAAAADPEEWRRFTEHYLQGDEAAYQKAIQSDSRPTRAEVCVVACAEAWRGDGAILASPMGLIPSLGARLARLTFAPDLLLTDGEAYLVDSGGQVEGWMPYPKVFTMLAAGRRHVMMGAAQIDRHGNQNISAIGDWRRPKAQLLGVRGAPGNTVNHPVSYWIPRHSPRVFTSRVDMVCGVGYDRGAHELRVVVTNLAVLDFGDAGAGDAAAFGPPGRGGRGRAGGHRLPARRPGPGAGHPVADGRRARADPHQARPGRGAGAGAAPGEPATPLTELLGIRYPVVQAAMGYVSGPRLAAAMSDAGGLGLIASATMSLPELERAIAETAGRTHAPFGVNLRADAPDAAERVRLIVARRSPSPRSRRPRSRS